MRVHDRCGLDHWNAVHLAYDFIPLSNVFRIYVYEIYTDINISLKPYISINMSQLMC